MHLHTFARRQGLRVMVPFIVDGMLKFKSPVGFCHGVGEVSEQRKCVPQLKQAGRVHGAQSLLGMAQTSDLSYFILLLFM